MYFLYTTPSSGGSVRAPAQKQQFIEGEPPFDHLKCLWHPDELVYVCCILGVNAACKPPLAERCEQKQQFLEGEPPFDYLEVYLSAVDVCLQQYWMRWPENYANATGGCGIVMEHYFWQNTVQKQQSLEGEPHFGHL
jgi:hypothetical protein